MNQEEFMAMSEAQLLKESFDETPYPTDNVVEKGASYTQYFFHDENDGKYRMEFVGTPRYGKDVSRVYVGKSTGGTTYVDKIDKFVNPRKMISTIIDIFTQYVTSHPKGMKVRGFIIDLSGGASIRAVPIMKKVIKANLVSKVKLTGQDFDPVANRKYIWVTRATLKPSEVFNGEKAQGAPWLVSGDKKEAGATSNSTNQRSRKELEKKLLALKPGDSVYGATSMDKNAKWFTIEKILKTTPDGIEVRVESLSQTVVLSLTLSSPKIITVSDVKTQGDTKDGTKKITIDRKEGLRQIFKEVLAQLTAMTPKKYHLSGDIDPQPRSELVTMKFYLDGTYFFQQEMALDSDDIKEPTRTAGSLVSGGSGVLGKEFKKYLKIFTDKEEDLARNRPDLQAKRVAEILEKNFDVGKAKISNGGSTYEYSTPGMALGVEAHNNPNQVYVVFNADRYEEIKLNFDEDKSAIKNKVVQFVEKFSKGEKSGNEIRKTFKLPPLSDPKKEGEDLEESELRRFADIISKEYKLGTPNVYRDASFQNHWKCDISSDGLKITLSPNWKYKDMSFYVRYNNFGDSSWTDMKFGASASDIKETVKKLFVNQMKKSGAGKDANPIRKKFGVELVSTTSVPVKKMFELGVEWKDDIEEHGVLIKVIGTNGVVRQYDSNTGDTNEFQMRLRDLYVSDWDLPDELQGKPVTAEIFYKYGAV